MILGKNVGKMCAAMTETPFLLKSVNESWEWAKNPRTQQMVISNWQWNVHNIQFRPDNDPQGKTIQL